MKRRLVAPALVLVGLVVAISGVFLAGRTDESPDPETRPAGPPQVAGPFDVIAPHLRGLPATSDGELTARRLVDRILEGIEGSPRPVILSAMGRDDWGVQWAGLLAVPRYGPGDAALAGALNRALASDVPQLRRTAAEACAYVGGESFDVVREGLRRAADDRAAGVRVAALQTFSRRRASHVPLVSMFEAALADENDEARTAGAYGLAQIELQEKLQPEVVDRLRAALVRALRDDVTDVVVYAVMALGRAGPRAGPDVPAILPLLGDERVLVRAQAANALGSIGPPALPYLQDALSAGRGRHLPSVLWALRQIGDAAHPVLAGALTHESALVRALAAQKLYELRHEVERALTTLMAVLTADDEEALLVAVRTLGRMGTEGARAAPALKAHRSHPDEKIRLAVEAALESITPRGG